MSSPTVRRALEEDLPAMDELLRVSGLSGEEMDKFLPHFFVATDHGEIIGVVGIEPYGTDGLLRSVAVSPAHRSHGVGDLLVGRAIEHARSLGIGRLILLTTTADRYFTARGFRRIARESVSGAVTGSLQFRGSCPASAVVMERILSLRILVLCTGNSCRSQMAEAFLRTFDPRLVVRSAGTSPARQVHPLAIQVMRETGLSLQGTPKNVDEFIEEPFDFVITVCDHARETCPLFTGTVGHRIHIGFDDPAGAAGTAEEALATFRRVRDEIRDRFRHFYHETLLPRL
jgi:arsenate reductase